MHFGSFDPKDLAAVSCGEAAARSAKVPTEAKGSKGSGCRGAIAGFGGDAPSHCWLDLFVFCSVFAACLVVNSEYSEGSKGSESVTLECLRSGL